MGRKPTTKATSTCYGYSVRAKVALSGMAMFPLLLILLVLWRGVDEDVSKDSLTEMVQVPPEYYHSGRQDIYDAQRRISELSGELEVLIKDVMVQQGEVERKCKDLLLDNGIIHNSLPDNPFNMLICEEIPNELIVTESRLLSCDEILHVLIPKSSVAELDTFYEFVSGSYEKEQVMLHWVSPKVPTIQWCLGGRYHNNELRSQCYKQANLKLIQEITMLKRLKLAGIVKVSPLASILCIFNVLVYVVLYYYHIFYCSVVLFVVVA